MSEHQFDRNRPKFCTPCWFQICEGCTRSVYVENMRHWVACPCPCQTSEEP